MRFIFLMFYCFLFIFSKNICALTSVGMVNNSDGYPSLGMQNLISQGLSGNIKAYNIKENLRNSPYYNPEVFCDKVGSGYYLPMLDDFFIMLKGENISSYNSKLSNDMFLNERRVGGLNSEWGRYLDLYTSSKFNLNVLDKSGLYFLTGTLIQDESNEVKRFLYNASI